MISLRIPCRQLFLSPKITRRWSSTPTSDPLRVLFCGSDKFSIASLKALYREHCAQTRLIKSIDVVCRPPKRVGRGLKQLRTVPIAEVARSLRLNLHEINTFKGWQPPEADGQAINLIVAVSFGLFIPPRILAGAKYGGLNVHPSMLPDLQGASPLHHTLLHGLSRTGISVQTLHPEQFDHGTILAQTPKPGFDIPNPDKITVPELTSIVAPMAAEMLLQVIKDQRYVPPVTGVDPVEAGQEHTSSRKAPRLTTEDRHINWKTWTADEILRKQRILGPLWNYLKTESNRRERRVLWSGGFTEVQDSSIASQETQDLEGLRDTSSEILMRTCDGHNLLISQVTLDGEQANTVLKALERAKLMSNDEKQPSIFQGRAWDMPC